VPGLVRGDRLLFLQYDDRRTRIAPLQGARHRQPDNAAADYYRRSRHA
jgi:hypothetical protein